MGSSSTALDLSDYADRTKDFTGREWILAEIDGWLADGDGPSFFLLTGAPGTGKSAIAARLVQARPTPAADRQKRASYSRWGRTVVRAMQVGAQAPTCSP